MRAGRACLLGQCGAKASGREWAEWPAGLRARREREERAGLLGWAGPELSLGPVGFGFAFLFPFLIFSISSSNKG